MNVLEAVRISLASIRTQKLRSFFTVLGTVVGVTFLIAVLTLLQGLDSYMTKEFAGQVYGFNTVMLRRTPSVSIDGDEETWREWRRRPSLTFDDAEWIGARMETPGVLAISADRSGRVDGPAGKTIEGVRIVGASGSYFRIRELSLRTGRVFSDHEADRGLPLAVIGTEVADALFPDVDPTGKPLRVQGNRYRVVGVLEEQGSLFGMSLDNVVVAPARSAVNGFVNEHDAVDEISFKVPDDRYLRPAMSEMEGWMRIRRALRPEQGNDFEVETAEASLSFWTKISNVMMIALPGLVGISLVVGAVVIMNIMLVSVAERTREIGLRKALGAKPRDILLQFLIEAGTLSGVGGVVGIAAGMALATLVSTVSPLPAEVSPGAILMGLALGVGVGVIAGVYPARRAARLDPIVALRKE